MASDHHNERIDRFIESTLADDHGQLSQSATAPLHSQVNKELAIHDAELSWLEGFEKAIKARIRTKYAHIASRRNSLVGIDKLPAEILSSIVNMSLDHFGPVPERNTTDRLLALQTVSRWWKQVLDQSPSVWGWIDYVRYVRFAVLKSKNARLWINLVNEPLSRRQLERTFDIILPHVQRWRYLRLRMEGSYAHTCCQVLSLVTAPALQHVGLISHGVRGDLLDTQILEGLNLQHLELNAMKPQWNTVATHKSLRSLRIGDSDHTTLPPSQEEVAKIFLGCPLLEDLEMFNFADRDLHFCSPTITRFHLPAMKSLSFKGISNSRGLFIWLLECLITPNLTSLVIKGGGSTGQAILEALHIWKPDAPFPAVVRSIQPRAVQVRTSRYETSITWGTGGWSGTVPCRGTEIVLRGIGYFGGFQRLVHSPERLQHTFLVDLLLIGEQGASKGSLDPDPGFIGSFPSLSILRLHNIPNTTEILQFLCNQSSTTIPCPGLKEIQILALPPDVQLDNAIKRLHSKRPDIVFDRP